MGFNNRYITKDLILLNINRLDYLFDADALIMMDMWSDRFYDDLNKSEKAIRDLINERFKFSSSLSYQSDPNYKDLSSMSECLISLSTNPTWLDVNLVNDKLDVKLGYTGDNFNTIVARCVEKIVEYYDKPNRNNKIDEILNESI